jgi:hypothetical protein
MAASQGGHEDKIGGNVRVIKSRKALQRLSGIVTNAGEDDGCKLFNRIPHYPLRIRPGGKASPNKLMRSVRSIGIAFLSRPTLTGDIPHFSSLVAI